MWNARRSVTLVVSLWLHGSPVWASPLLAQPVRLATALADARRPPAAEDSAGAANDAALDQPSAEQAAEKLWSEASELYSQGNFQGAYDKMQAYYQLTQDPRMLYNLGDLSRELQHCAEAVSEFEAYLEKAPDGAYRAQAQAALRELRPQCPATSAAQAKSSPPAGTEASSAKAIPSPPASPQLAVMPPGSSAVGKPSRESISTRQVVGYSLLAVGAAAGVGAGVLLASAIDKNNQIEADNRAAATQPPESRPVWSPADEELEHERNRQRNWAVALGLGSTALLASGVVTLLWRSDAGAASSQPTVAVHSYAQGFGVSVKVGAM